MKGVVFTEFVEMVESKFGSAMVDRIIEKSELPSGGSYTVVGTYDHSEILKLVGELSTATETPAPALVKAFGRHLLGFFATHYPQFFTAVASPADFLERVDDYIHVEVRKLYPDAQLPRFVPHRTGPDSMTLDYRSPRPFADLAEGLIEGCAAHFGRSLSLRREEVADAGGNLVRFTLRFGPKGDRADS